MRGSADSLRWQSRGPTLCSASRLVSVSGDEAQAPKRRACSVPKNSSNVGRTSATIAWGLGTLAERSIIRHGQSRASVRYKEAHLASRSIPTSTARSVRSSSQSIRSSVLHDRLAVRERDAAEEIEAVVMLLELVEH